MEIRLQKYLADAGVASRRASEELIKAGKIKVNGSVVKEMGVKINPCKDQVFYNKKRVGRKERFLYFIVNKPKGYITTSKDEKNRKIVLDLVDVEERLFTIGRLDQATSGLLILTNDGDLTYKLTHPKHEIGKTYIADVAPPVAPEKVDQLRSGIQIEDYKTAPCFIKLQRATDEYESYKLVIHEGKNRQIRKMFEAVGSQVISLKRTKIGEITLGSLKRGAYRPLSQSEINYLKGLEICLAVELPMMFMS
ncbi:MAG: pseudouridine synthase [Vallitaleaceae bacterium]|jgi:23S rRNA pseudouridine2605 synthase|nr:pseudouridine synthase [Vallitaleaceae bacterium]